MALRRAAAPPRRTARCRSRRFWRRARRIAPAPPRKPLPKRDRRRTGAGPAAARRVSRRPASARRRAPAAAANTDRPRPGRRSRCSIAIASSTVSAKTETQSSVRQAGTTPAVETRPRLGLSPTMLLKPAGTRPDPAVSVPSASGVKPGADRERRAGARTAGNELSIEQIAADAVRRAHADQAGRELIEIGLAENERAGLAQPRDARGVPVRTIAVSRARRRGRQALDVDIVLDRDRNAVERQRLIAVLLRARAPRRRRPLLRAAR